MDLETTQTNTTAKLPLLKQGEYDMCKLRIEKYFQVQDYALWDVIENGNSFKLAGQTTTNVDGSSTTLIPGPYKDSNTLFAAIQTRFGGNDATKKTQKTLLKQMYENFSAPSTESLDSIFNRLQKINVVFMSSSSSTNEVNTAYGVSTINTQVSPASTQVSTASTQVSTAKLSDATVYAFLANQTNGSQLVHEDLEKIHEDDLEEMDLKWQLALLSMRTRKGPRNQDNRSRNQDSSRRTINVEDTSSKAMLAIDGASLTVALWQMKNSL
ncbi:hypothetical protein Tco_0712874 [Tanacetum coccineum]